MTGSLREIQALEQMKDRHQDGVLVAMVSELEVSFQAFHDATVHSHAIVKAAATAAISQ